MTIIKKEMLEFSKEEKNALEMVSKICTGIMQEADDPDLREWAQEIFGNIFNILECEEKYEM